MNVYNPYNFIRFLAEPQGPTGAQRLLWRCPPPPRDRASGYSGSIGVTLTALTPLHVPDAEGVTTDNVWVENRRQQHPTYPFFTQQRTRMLPGATLHGPVRARLEAVTNSCWLVFDPRHTARRQSTDDYLTPARVTYDNGEWKLQLLRGDADSDTAKFNNPRLQPAHVPKAKVVDIPNESRVQFQRSGWKQFRRPLPGGGLIEYQWIEVTDILPLAESEQPEDGWLEGWLYKTGANNARNKEYERVFYDLRAKPRTVALSTALRLQYNALIENYREIHKDDTHPAGLPDIDFSWFMYGERAPQIQHGRLVYAHIAPNNAPDYLAPVGLPRLASRQPRWMFLPEHLRPCTDARNLCPACRIFGWARADDASLADTDAIALAGRVQIGTAREVGYTPPPGLTEAEQQQLDRLFPINGTRREGRFVLPILSSPKPAYALDYLRPKNHRPRPGLQRHEYGYDNHQPYPLNGPPHRAEKELSGRKVYRRQSMAAMLHWKPFSWRQDQRSNQNRTVTGVAPPGTRFSFQVRFRDLQPVELGALLWTLTSFDKTGALSIGHAKPLGFGVMRAEITEFSATHAAVAFGTGQADVATAAAQPVAAPPLRCTAVSDTAPFVAAFTESLGAMYGVPFEELPNVRDLRALTVKEETARVAYPMLPFAQEGYQWFNANEHNNDGLKIPLDLADPGALGERPLPLNPRTYGLGTVFEIDEATPAWRDAY